MALFIAIFSIDWDEMSKLLDKYNTWVYTVQVHWNQFWLTHGNRLDKYHGPVAKQISKYTSFTTGGTTFLRPVR